MNLYDVLSTTDESRKSICIERSTRRKKIKTELDDSLGKVRNRKGLLAEKAMFYSISKINHGSSRLIFYFEPKDWNIVTKWEFKNLSLYYDALYTPNIPKPVVDMLLKQKHEIENYLSEEV
ncbi:hypothetical protein [Gramella sp. KN1008]|uniref:hypothetical protein n=1 Tax=Gramella sp. KN1008 TaxID=2529298 RepID=UPI00103F3CA1|nr:hypothetical protein [Gramella sp. KN1008]TBW28335.1 hypothetical protein EZJ28_06200 [Gramella sp. KN1008]